MTGARTGLVPVGGPEARGIRGERLVDQNQIPLIIRPELELGVGDDDAAPTA